MTRAANDNDPVSRYGSTVRPRDESAPQALMIGMEVEAPLTDKQIAVALETLDGGLSVLVLGRTQQDANDGAWALVRAMAPEVAR